MLLIIIFNNILLNLSIIVIEYFILIGLISQYTKSDLFMIENQFFYNTLLNNILVCYCMIEKHTILLFYYGKMYHLLFYYFSI